MKRFLLASAVAIVSATVTAQTTDDLKIGGSRPEQVLNYGLGYGLQRFSPLTQIDKSSIKRLVPVWAYSLNDSLGQEGQPLLADGVLYFATARATVAVDAVSGKQLWKSPLDFAADVPRVLCCGQTARGVAIYDGRLYRTTLDARILALDLKTGKQLWSTVAADYRQGYSMTGAPLVADGVLITGVAGGEFGARDFLDGTDPKTGERLWRRYTVPLPAEPGGKTWPVGAAEHGGGSTWLTGSYDPQLGLVYWGVGNPGPWNTSVRKGDNLFTDTVLALRPKTGEIVWHYQFTPNDPFDYDGANELVQADLTVAGKPRKVIMQADRNGFFYVIDRVSGKLLAANPFVKVNWAERVDLKTGRPVETDVARNARAGIDITVWPSVLGGKNWSPMAYDPDRRLAFANTVNAGSHYKAVSPVVYRQGAMYVGVERPLPVFPDVERGFLKAIDPLTGQAKWAHGWAIPSFSGVLATAGGLVFTGTMTGEFMALDADTGETLWSFQTGSGIVGQPITWQKDGRQYVTVPSGIGGLYTLFIGDERLASVPAGGSLWTFALLP